MTPSHEGDMVVLTQGRLVARIGAATPVRAFIFGRRRICKSDRRPLVFHSPPGPQATPASSSPG
jgi:hypothetical protein